MGLFMISAGTMPVDSGLFLCPAETCCEKEIRFLFIFIIFQEASG